MSGRNPDNFFPFLAAIWLTHIGRFTLTSRHCKGPSPFVGTAVSCQHRPYCDQIWKGNPNLNSYVFVVASCNLQVNSDLRGNSIGCSQWLHGLNLRQYAICIYRYLVIFPMQMIPHIGYTDIHDVSIHFI